MNHTPAPWYAIEFAGYWTLCDRDAYVSVGLLDESQCAKAEANAVLAAAAPELLKICVKTLEILKQIDKGVLNEISAKNQAHAAAIKMEEVIKTATKSW